MRLFRTITVAIACCVSAGLALGQSESRNGLPSQGGPTATSTREDLSPIAVLSVPLSSLDVQVVDRTHFVLVDRTSEHKPVYEYRVDPAMHNISTLEAVRTMFTPRLFCLDDKGNLYVFSHCFTYSHGTKERVMRIESPTVARSAAYTEESIEYPSVLREAIFAALTNLRFRDGTAPLGDVAASRLGSIKVEQDVNDPDVQKKSLLNLRKEVVEFLNARLVSWTESLYEAVEQFGGERVFAKIRLRPQELALAKEVRSLQEQKQGGASYRRKLRLVNRLLLDRLLERARPGTEYYGAYLDGKVKWDWMARGDDGGAFDAPKNVSELERRIVSALSRCTSERADAKLECRPDGKLVFTANNQAVLVLDAETGNVEPSSTDKAEGRSPQP